ncbi:MAG: hypothetical protein PVS2B2_23670 [Candidatus Acidiferrum sp.]
MKVEPEDDAPLSDEIKPEEGRVRYWMFINGEQMRLFSALVAAGCGVLWCFLYVLGAGRSVVGIVLLAAGGVSFVIWRMFDRQLREYEGSAWKKDMRSPKLEKIEFKVAIGLWLFILIAAGSIIIMGWRQAQ